MKREKSRYRGGCRTSLKCVMAGDKSFIVAEAWRLQPQQHHQDHQNVPFVATKWNITATENYLLQPCSHKFYPMKMLRTEIHLYCSSTCQINPGKSLRRGSMSCATGSEASLKGKWWIHGVNVLRVLELYCSVNMELVLFKIIQVDDCLRYEGGMYWYFVFVWGPAFSFLWKWYAANSVSYYKRNTTA